jgi:CRISPR-associated endonuclease/helicase Cas3
MYYAHSENKSGEWESVYEHLNEVSRLSKQFANEWGCSLEGEIAGLFHDLGKYTDLFQTVLRGAIKIDHATPGAAAALYQYKLNGIASAIAIQGHHDGLQYGDLENLKNELSMRNTRSKLGKTYSSQNFKQLINHLLTDFKNIPDHNDLDSIYLKLCQRGINITAMLYVRMLFSALVDADYLATEAHFQGDKSGKKYRHTAPTLNPDKGIKNLLSYKKNIENNSTADSKINQIRNDLFNACCNSAKKPKGIFTLSAPTGSGKTLAMLAFALYHAKANGHRRIIIVLPFLNIIEQMARTYKEIFDEKRAPSIILEDHSLSDYDGNEEGNYRLFSENWDSPIIITTTVKFFESLFSNQPSSCRKLHNIANSIIIFDEAQTMPANLMIPTLNALTALNNRFGCSVVFSTATQPAYESLNDFLKNKCEIQWNPIEIIPDDLKLFERSRRVKPVWLRNTMPFEKIANDISSEKQVLVIVNLRRHARDLFDRVSATTDDTFHLSTNMCPSHRLDTLNQIRERLENQLPCKVISTQCIEAGVDIDFPIVWRSIAPLEAIIQAAGRCNRNGNNEGHVYIFNPDSEEDKYPGNEYKWGAITVKGMLMDQEIDLCDTGAIKTYYKKYFNSIRIDKINPNLNSAILKLNFKDTDKHYKWIPSRGINILVPYKNKLNKFNLLKDEAFTKGFSRRWAHDAQELCVNVMLKQDSPLHEYITEIMVIKGGKEEEGSKYYVLLNDSLYHDKYGIDLANTGDEGFFTVT